MPIKRAITYDFENMLAEKAGKAGCGDEELSELVRKLEDVRRLLREQDRRGEVGYFRIPAMAKELRQTVSLAAEVRRSFKTLVVCGIGGSDLGARTFISSLAEQKKGMDVRFIGANTDPEEIADLLATVDWKKSCVNIISKSGDTIEPMSTFLVLRDRLAKTVGVRAVGKRVVATTDIKEGTLRLIANREGYRTLPVPSDIGGRFSALTPVGLFPAACAGIDVKGLVAGAAAALDDFWSFPVGECGPLMFAGLHYDAYVRRFQHISVLMPYAAKLRDFSFWFRQLWAESLGKKYDRADHEVHHGLTPVAALGATDQHSQLQLYNEGPVDKIMTFIDVERFRRDFVVPRPFKDVEGLAYMAGHSFSEIIRAELASTASALTAHGRPSGVIRIKELSPQSMGSLMMFFMLATSAAGELLNVNAYDQPGVEQGKRTLYAMLGRQGFGKR